MALPPHAFDRARELLRRLVSERTFRHCLAVVEEAQRLAAPYDADVAAARWAGLLHDCAKELDGAACLAAAGEARLEVLPEERAHPRVLHQRVGARWAAERFGVTAAAVLEAIGCHTTGKGEMDGLSRCLFVADWTSSDRDYDGVDTLREAVAKGPAEGFVAVLRCKREVVRVRGLPQHPWAREAYERWLG
ncbi:MAG: bis(5'-nucleosyl)-tetraphosphatase (symmetrical) YqeK [bacterium]